MFAGALLDCGAYDLGMTPSVVTSTNETLVLTHDWLYGLLEIGLPGYSREQRRVPSLSPALADLTGMPPALFTVGNLDPTCGRSTSCGPRSWSGTAAAWATSTASTPSGRSWRRTPPVRSPACTYGSTT
jgi:hypothetical protein